MKAATLRCGFELALLDAMTASYTEAVLRDVGMTRGQVERWRAAPGKQFLMGAVSMEEVVAALGAPHRVERLAEPDTYGGCDAHAFLLQLWPHLDWVVFTRPSGLIAGFEFRNQRPLSMADLEPALIRPGVWCQHAVQRLADEAQLYDGWAEWHVVHLRFGEARYEGEFVWGLLQSWRRLDGGNEASGDAE